VTSPNLLPAAPGEDAVREISVGDIDLDDRVNQYILASREGNAGLDQPTTPCEKLSTEVMPTTNVQPTKIISEEDFDQLEKVNPLDASNVSADDPSETSKENLLAEFQSKVLGANLFEAIEQDENIIVEVKKLLCKLGRLLSGS